MKKAGMFVDGLISFVIVMVIVHMFLMFEVACAKQRKADKPAVVETQVVYR